MSDVRLSMADGMWGSIVKHLLPKRAMFEEAAFVFATVEEKPASITLQTIEWYPVPPEEFDEQSPYFLQLTDETKAKIIKRAHDLQSALIEVHSHPFQQQAEFSHSDLMGFSEFVPHVRWRLRSRPYAAIVVADRTFDALTWVGNGTEAGPLTAIIADGNHHHATGATHARAGGANGSR